MADSVVALTVFNDGTGPALYAGGRFITAGGVPANRIAKWNGSAWSALGSGMNHWVYALTGFDDGTGPALYAGGVFTTAGGVPANRIAKWNGSAWSALGSGMDFSVYALTVFDDGTGPALYAGGYFTTAGGVPANRIAKWNGSAWSALGSGMSASVTVGALTVFNDGTGPALYAGGNFITAGGVPANRIAKWNGSAWSALGSGMSCCGTVLDLTVFDDGTGPALYAGGYFTTAGGAVSRFIAEWSSMRRGAVNAGFGPVTDVLFVNDSPGDSRRVVTVGISQPVSLSLRSAPGGPASARNVVWLWPRTPANPVDLRLGGSSLGCLVNPTPVNQPMQPQPLVCLRSGIPVTACTGTRELASPGRAPWTLMRNRGSSRAATFTVQGVVEDGGSANILGFSATNAVILDVR